MLQTHLHFRGIYIADIADALTLQTHLHCRCTYIADALTLQMHLCCRHTYVADTLTLQTHLCCLLVRVALILHLYPQVALMLTLTMFALKSRHDSLLSCVTLIKKQICYTYSIEIALLKNDYLSCTMVVLTNHRTC